MKYLLTALLLCTALSSFAQDEPNPDEFIQVDVEPTPLTPLQSFVRYPEEAQRAGKEGRVIISALIDEAGKVTKVQIEKSSDRIFDEAAKEALLAATFSPAMHGGKQVKIWYTVPITFKLTEKDKKEKDGGVPSGAQLKSLQDSLDKHIQKK